ncbi:MAG: cobalt-precorrin-5B (C(1))-methyltransferase CbiD [Leptolyngbyaceae cyanobacterium MO_188.B28]|nr:cobalt-precorrin-5B (C(1))-methyltransferase CbiD [Leptolyngbyaceae cyanobacterium MO_188.B28]
MAHATEPQFRRPRPGYTLPVFACAAAIAALRHLHQPVDSLTAVTVDLIEPAETAEIPVEQVAQLPDGSVLAITRSDPGDNLDLTRNTPIWAVVARGDEHQTEPIQLQGGEGIGRQTTAGDKAAIYAYAERLLRENLSQVLSPGETIRVTIILPEGRALGQRTSNAAFGVVEGLSLLGTTGISQPLSAPGQLDIFRSELRQKAAIYNTLVFCVGENGLDLAVQLGVEPDRRIKTANWLGPMLVEAGLQGVSSLVLFGYHGKLIKLAGGIFHTHHHLADGRQEILAAHCASLGLPTADIQTILASKTAEASLTHLRGLDQTPGQNWVKAVYGAIAGRIDQRAQAYIQAHSERRVVVGSALFDRSRQIIITSEIAATLLPQVWYAR